MNSDRFYFRRFFKKPATPKAPARKRLMETMEDRILYDAVPVVTVEAPATAEIGETVQVTVGFDNTSATDSGFGPWVDVFVDRTGADGVMDPGDPDGLTLSGTPNYLGSALAPTVITLDNTANGGRGVLHPFAVDGSGQALYISTVLDNNGTPLDASDDRNEITYTSYADPLNPVVVRSVNGSDYQNGDMLLVFELPFGSFTPDQPEAEIRFNLTLSENADIGVPLSITALGGFRFGNDALNNPSSDPSIIGVPSGDVVTVDATLATVTKEYLGPENETSTGPNFPRAYRININIAAGQTLENLNIYDVLPPELQYTGFTSSAGVTLEPGSTATTTSTGGTLHFTFDNPVTGTSGDIDAWIEVQFYVPLVYDSNGNNVIDAGDSPVLAANSGVDKIVSNQAYGFASWTPLDVRDDPVILGFNVDGGFDATSLLTAAASAAPDAAFEHPALEVSPLVIQKNVVNILRWNGVAYESLETLLGGNPGGDSGGAYTQRDWDALRDNIRPDDIVEYALDFQVSDYFGVRDVVIDDVLSDGQRLDATYTPTLTVNGILQNDNATRDTLGVTTWNNGFTSTVNSDNNLATPATDGSTDIQFDVSAQLMALGFSGILLGGAVDPANPAAATTNLPAYNNGGTTGRIVYRVTILDAFTDTAPSGEAALNSRDELSNEVDVTAELIDLTTGTAFAAHAVPVTTTDDSGETLTIEEATLSKTIYAINGNTTLSDFWDADGNINLQPGDIVTYRLTYVLPTGDVEDLRFTDYLPLPIFSVNNPDSNGTAGGISEWSFNNAGGIPGSGVVTYGPDHTLDNATSAPADPSLSINSGSNSIRFEIGDSINTTNQTLTVDLLFSVTVSDDPFADGLFLTNQVQSGEQNTQQPGLENESNINAIVQVVLNEPQVDIYKGVIASTQGGTTAAGGQVGGLDFADLSGDGFTVDAGAGFGLSESSDAAAIGALDLNAGILPDAGDTVRYAIVAQNTGRADAFDVTVQDTIAGSFVNNYMDAAALQAGTNLQVYRGDGTLLTSGVDYTVAWNTTTKTFTVELTDNYVGGNTTGDVKAGGLSRGINVATGDNMENGSNSIVVLYDLTVATTAQLSSTVTNTAKLTNYAGIEGGADHTTEDKSNSATVILRDPVISKVVTATSVNETGNDLLNQAVVGEIVTYQVTITIPEGTTLDAVLRDTMPAGLAFVDVVSVAYSSGAITSVNTIGTGTGASAGNGPANVTLGNASGGTANLVSFNLGTITNTDTDNMTAEQVVITYRAVVVNVTGNQGGTVLTNQAVLDYVWTDDRAAVVVAAATTANLAGASFATTNRGTFTGVASSIDGVALGLGDLVLVKDQNSAAQNGIYIVTSLGGGMNDVTLVRYDGFDQSAEMRGNPIASVAVVGGGTVNAGARYALTDNVGTVNSSAVNFALVMGSLGSSNIAADSITVVEPQLTTSNRISTNYTNDGNAGNDTWVDNGTLQASAGQNVFYELVINNPGALTAYDVSFYDRLPNVLVSGDPAITFVLTATRTDSMGNVVGVQPLLTDFGIATDQSFGVASQLPALFSNVFLDLAPGEKITIVVQSRVKDDAVAASTHPNGVQVRWTSLNDGVRSADGTDNDVHVSTPTLGGAVPVPVVHSIHNTNAVERTGGQGPDYPLGNPQPGPPIDVLNDYAVTDDATQTILQIDPVAIVKQLLGSEIDNATNSDTQAVVGEYVDYSISFDIPKGQTREFVLTDTLADGLVFVDFLSVTVGQNVTTNVDGSNNATGASLVYAAGDPLDPTNLSRLDTATTVDADGGGFVINFGEVYNDAVAGVPGGYVPPQQITITYRVLVTNVATNQAGQTLNNTAAIAYKTTADNVVTNVNVSDTADDAVTVIEPVLTVTAQISTVNGGPYVNTLPTAPDASDPVYYEIVINNPSGAGNTTAYDLYLNDTFPAALTGFVITSVIKTGAGAYSSTNGVDPVVTTTMSGVDVSDDFDISVGGVLSVKAGHNVDLGSGTTITIRVSAQLGSTVTPAQIVSNSATVRWTSIDGVETDRAPALDVGITTDAERDGGILTPAAGTNAAQAANQAAPINNYAATSAAATFTSSLPVLTKTIVATSENFTTDSATGTGSTEGWRTAVGEIVRYRLVALIPEGTSPDLHLFDRLPDGMVFINDGTATVGFLSTGAGQITSTTISDGSAFLLGGDPTLATPVYSLPDAAVSSDRMSDAENFASGSDVYFKLGTVVNANATNGQLEYVIIEFNALVLNTTANQSGTALNSDFQYRINGGSTNTQVGANSVQGAANRAVMAEPNLTVSKGSSTTGPVNAGDTFTYTITIQNNSSGVNSAPAFDIHVQDIVDQILASNPTAELEYLGYSLSLPAETGLPADASSTVTDTLDLTFDRLNAGSTLTITVNVQVKTGAVAGAEIENKAVVTYSSLPGGTGTGGMGSTIASALAGSTVTGATLTALTAATSERTGADSVGTVTDNTPPGTDSILNNYAIAASSAAGLIVQVPTIDKQWKDGTLTADDTGSTASADDDVVIGETFTYDLVITLPEGVTENLQIRDLLPEGFRIDNITILGNGAGLSWDGTPVTGNMAVSGTGAEHVISFGDVTVTVGGDNTFTIRVTGTVENIPANVAGDILTGAARLTFDDPDGTTNSSTTAVNTSLTDGTAGNNPAFIIVEPVLTLTNEITDGTNFDAGDIVTITMTAENTGGSDAFDVVITNTISATKFDIDTLDFGVAGVDYPAGYTPSAVVVGANIVITYTGPAIEAGEPELSFAFTIELTDAVTPGETLTSAARITEASSLPTDVTDERDYTVGPVNDTLAIIAPFAVTKALTNTSLGSDTSATVVIGEVLTYTVTVTVMEGTTSNIVLNDTLPAGLEFVANSAVLTANGMTISGFNINTLDQTLTSVVNPGNTDNTGTADTDTFTYTYQVRVTNIAGNQTGSTLLNDLDASATGVTSDNNNQVTVTVAEPVLGLVKTTTTPGTDAGDTVVYTLVITNTGNATAYDVNILDALDTELELVTPGSALAITGGLPAYASLVQTGNTVSAVNTVLNELRAGDTITVTITARLKAAAPAGSEVTNSATVTYSSLPGTPVGERTGSGVVPNDYTVSDTSDPFTIATPAITKAITATSEAETAFTANTGDVLIGETVTYTLSVTIPEGQTGSVTIVDTLPPGLAFVDGTTAVNFTSSGVTPFAAPTPVVTGAVATGQTVTWTIGTITNPPGAGGETFTLTYTVRVADIASNVRGVDRQNSAALTYADPDGPTNNGTPANVTVQTPTDPTVNILEPRLTTTKAASDTTPDIGDVVTYTLTVTNTANANGATAYDINVRDTLPSGLTLDVTPANILINGVAIDVSPLVTAYDLSDDGLLSLSLGSLANGASVTITYDVTVTNALNVIGTTQNNNVRVTYDSLPGDEAAILTGTPDGDSRYTDTDGTPDRNYGPGNTAEDPTPIVDDPAQDTAGITVNAASISGYVYLDADNDGVFDGSEDGVGAGIEITLTGTTATGLAVSLTTTTDADGRYEFTGLAKGTYVLAQTTQPLGYLDGKETAGASFGGTVNNAAVSNSITNIVIPDGSVTDATGYNFGELAGASISGTVYRDFDNDGTIDGGELPQEGVTVTLTGTDDFGAITPIITTTLADGTYSFVDLRPGTYTVTKGLTPGYNDGKETAGSTTGTVNNAAISSTITTIPVTGAGGAASTSTGNNFGELDPVSISGFVYLDLNDDGTKQGNESGIAGVTITLTGTDDLGQAVNTVLVTDSTGAYSFTGLRPGTYVVTQTDPAVYGDGDDTLGTGFTPATGNNNGTAGNDTFTGIVVANVAPANNDGANYNFGEQFTPQVTKTIVTTSEASSTGANVLVGEIVRYRLVTSVPYGNLADFRIIDNLPPGLQFLGDGTATIGFVSSTAGNLTSSTIGAGGHLAAVGSPSLVIPGAAIIEENPGAAGFASGENVIFNLGAIANTDAGANEFIVIEFNALVVNDSNVAAGNVLNNNFSVRYDTTGDAANDPVVTSTDVPVTVREADVSLDKSIVGGAPIAPDAGDTFTYRFVITNSNAANTATAYELRLRDIFDQAGLGNLAADVELVDFTIGGDIAATVPGYVTTTNNSSASALDLTFSELRLGDSITIDVTVRVKDIAPAGSNIENSATVTWTSLPGDGTPVGVDNTTGSATPGDSGDLDGERDGTDYNDTDTTAAVTVATPVIDKQNASVTTATIGQAFTYDIVVTLPEGITEDLVILDQLPPGLVLVGVTVIPGDFAGTVDTTPTVTGGVTSGQDLVITFGDTTTDVDAGAGTNTFTVRVEVRVVNELGNQAGDTLANTATLTYTNGTTALLATVTDAVAPAAVTIVEPALTIEQSVNDDTPHLDDVIAVTVNLFNEDTLTGATAYDISIVGVIPADKYQSISNIVVTRYDMNGTLATGNDADLGVLVEGVDYTISSSAEGYTITLLGALAEDERIGITYDARVSATPADVLGAGGLFGGADDSFNTVVTATWSSLALAPAGERTGADGAGPDATVLNNYVAADTDTLTVVGAGLNLVKQIIAINGVLNADATPTIEPQDDFTYSLTITNVGTDVATSVVLVDTLPPQITVNQVRVDGVITAFSIVSGQITLNLADIPNGVGNVVIVEIDATLDTTIDVGRESIKNTARVDHDDIDPTPLDNEDDVDALIEAAPVFVVTKTDNLVAAAPGDPVTYTITVTNTGNQNALVDIRDVFPVDQLTLIGVAAFTDSEGIIHPALTAADLVGGELLWTNVALNDGDTLILTISAVVTNPQTQSFTDFDNTVTVSDTEGEAPDVSATDSTNLPATPDLVATKTNSTTRIGINDTFTYTITVANIGNQNATGVTVIDELPPFVEFIGASGNFVFTPGTTPGSAGTITWISANNPELAVVQGQGLETITYTVTVKLPMNSIVFGTLTNNVRVFDDGTNGADTNPDNNDAFDTTDVLGFIYDRVNNFSLFGDDDDNENDYHLGLPIKVYRDAILPIAPIYSGAAEPGSTLEVALYNADGEVIGRQTVVVDTGGNWMASFPGTIMKDYPQSVVITQTPASTSTGDTASGYNLRPYYATAINAGHFFRENLNVARVSEQTSERITDDMQDALSNPIGFEINATAYESLASPGQPTGR